jgi:bidirectional [NiFe] hydrogenase diaphorase subunit
MDRADLAEIAERERRSRKPVRVHCCTASGCLASNSQAVKDGLEQATAAGLADRVEVVGVGCLGLCGRGPLVQMEPSGELYERVTLETAPSILAGLDGGHVEAPRGDPRHPFFSSQQKIVCETSGRIDPERIEEYVTAGGYQALARALA